MHLRNNAQSNNGVSMKVLIADDELNICKLIKNLVDWDTLGLELLGFACNGNETCDMIAAHMPDIVITDIRMPGKNGLEIIKECTEQGFNVQFIIVSGHAEFDYARQAIRYGVNDFLLKPVNHDELIEVLERVIARVSDAGEDSRTMKETLENSRTVLRNSLLLSLYYRDFNSRNKSIETLNSEFCFDFKTGLFMPAVVKLHVLDKQGKHAKNMLSQMKAIIEKELQAISSDFCVCEKGLSLLCLFNFSEHQINEFQIALQYALDLLLNLIAPYDLYQLVMGTGESVRLPKELQASFSQAVCACDSRLCLGGNRMISGAGMDTRLLNSALISIEEPNRILNPAIEMLDTECFRALFREEFLRQMPDMALYPYSINAYIRRFAAALLRDIAAVHKVSDNELRNKSSILENVLKSQSLNEAINELENRFCGLLEQIQAVSPGRKAVKIVKSYIEQNFNQRIRLEDAAEKVFLSPAYLGILFKHETGQNFSDYLIAVRIEKAKEMLKDIRFNINEISENVGYKDTRYFSKLFKGIVGVKPSQYRQMFARGDLT